MFFQKKFFGWGKKTLEGGGLLSEKKSSPSQTHLLSRNFPKLPCRNGRKLGKILFMGGMAFVSAPCGFDGISGNAAKAKIPL